MSAGILEYDRGIVQGEATWHRLPQYLIQAEPVTIAQAREVMGYKIEKAQLFHQDGRLVEGAFTLVRTDKDISVWPSVGTRYTVIDNDLLITYLENSLFAEYPDLVIESVGTLWNGQVSFLNIKLDKFQVKGDQSETVTNLMYANRHGGGCASACAHSTRIVCSNTLAMAETQGAAQETLKKFRHTAGAEEKLKAHLIDLANIYAGVREHKALLDTLASMEVDMAYVETYLGTLSPVPNADVTDGGEITNVRSRTMAKTKQAAILEIFEGDQSLNGASRTRYGLLQATMEYVDHKATTRNSDEGHRYWDRIWGSKNEAKQQALSLLTPA